MAVEDKYVVGQFTSADGRAAPHKGMGATVRSIVTELEVAAADDNGSIYRLARLSSQDVIKNITIYNDAITGGTDYDLGLYEPGPGGAEKDKDLLVNGADLSSANGIGSGLSGLSALTINDLDKNVMELAGDTASTGRRYYDLALTGNTVGTAAGTVVVVVDLLQG